MRAGKIGEGPEAPDGDVRIAPARAPYPYPNPCPGKVVGARAGPAYGVGIPVGAQELGLGIVLVLVLVLVLPGCVVPNGADVGPAAVPRVSCGGGRSHSNSPPSGMCCTTTRFPRTSA